MTYRELFYKATRLIDKGEITLGEYDEMTKPLDREIEQQQMRDATPEEQKSVDDYIKSISKPTGVNFWALEQQPCEDVISRQAVLEITAETGALETQARVKVLPPVTQKPIECDDAISRQVALKELRESAEHHANDSREEVLLRRDRDIIKALPPVTPQPKYGKWIKDECGNVICSECKRFQRDCRYGHTNYCNHCGTRMVEPQESEEQE